MSVCAIILAAALPVFDFATNSIANRIAGADPAVCLSRFADYPPSRGKLGFLRCLWEKPFPANDKFWLKDVDFSCASPWNSAGGAQRAGTLISKRHIAFAKHFPLWKDVRIVFVGKDGAICPCYVERTKGIEKSDIMIGLLNAEVTPNIHPAKILPPDYEKYLGDGEGFPVVTFNQKEQLFLTELDLMKTMAYPLRQAASHNPKKENWRRFREPIVGGDSGNPAFLLIGDSPILLYCLKSGGCGSGHAYHLFRSEIQAAMDELCPGYKLESFDFSKVGK